MVRDKHLQIIQSLINNYKKDKIDVAMISGYSFFSVSKSELDSLEFENLKVLYHSYSEEDMKKPYEPFLDWIKEIYDNNFSQRYSIKEFLDKTDIHSELRRTIENYLITGELKKYDEYVFFTGINDYEEHRFIELITKILTVICEQNNICIFLDKLQFAGSSTIRLLLELCKVKINNLLCICTYNEKFKISAYMRKEWTKLIEKCKNDDYLFESDYYDDEINIGFDTSQYTVNLDNVRTDIRKIRNMLITCAYNQAAYYSELIMSSIMSSDKALSISDKDFYDICFLSMFCLAYTGNTKQAKDVALCVKERIRTQNNINVDDFNLNDVIHDKAIIKVLYRLNYLHYWINVFSVKSSFYYANIYATESVKYAELLRDDDCIFKARIARDMSQMMHIEWYDQRNKLRDKRESESYYKSMINEAFEREQPLVAAIYLAIAFENEREILEKIENDEAEFIYFSDAVSIISKLNNIHIMKHIHDYKTLFAYHYEFNNVSAKIYRICNEYISNDSEIIIENGYTYTLREQYNNAHRVNNRKINYLYNRYINSKNSIQNMSEYLENNYYLSEVAVTIFDMAKDNIYMKNFKKAEKYISATLTIIDNLSKTGLFNASRGLLYSLRAYCSLVCDKVYKCYEDIWRAEAFFAHILNNEYNVDISYGDTFYYNLVKGKLAIYEGDYESAQSYFNRSFDIFSKTENEYMLTYDIICAEQAELYNIIGRNDLAIKTLVDCKNFYLKTGLKKRADYLTGLIEGREVTIDKNNYILKGVQINELVNASFNERKELQIKEEQNSNLFITSWLELMNSFGTDEDVVTTITKIRDMLEMSYALYLKVDSNDTCNVLYHDSDYYISQEDLVDITGFFSNHQDPFCITRIEKEYKTLGRIINIFGEDEVEVIIGIPIVNKGKISRICIMVRPIKDYIKVSRDNYLLDKKFETAILAIDQLYDTESRIENMKKEEYRINLEIAAKTAEESNRSKSIFLANMSHEIRTPLNAILGMSEIVLREELPDIAREYVKNIRGAGHTLLSLINDILDFSKIEAGKLEILDAQYNFNSLINDIKNMMIFRIANKPIELEFNVAKDIPENLVGDEIRLRQIFINLINNAIKFTNSGKITVNVDCRKENDMIIIMGQITDTGIGIREEDIDKLFNSFERVDVKRNRKIEGTGLGLAICKQLLLIMNGSIDVKSEYGKGSTFTFELPQKVNNFDKEYDSTIDAFINSMSTVNIKDCDIFLPDIKVLVVDDNDMNLKVTKGLLKPLKCKVVTCLSGKECIERVKRTMQVDREGYDIIFLDHMMPDMDGIETLSELKKIEGFNIPVVALTANAVSGVKEMYLSNGFDDYLSKPVNGTSLRLMLLKCLSRK